MNYYMPTHDPNCVQIILISQTKTKNRVLDYTKDCFLCADCFDNNDTTPAPGNGQGGSYPLGTSRVRGEQRCTDWLHTTTSYLMYIHICDPCIHFSFGSSDSYYKETNCNPCQSQEDFTCPEGQYAGGVYDC